MYVLVVEEPIHSFDDEAVRSCKITSLLESDNDALVGEDTVSAVIVVRSATDRGTVGSVHSKTVNGRANDLSYMEIENIMSRCIMHLTILAK